MIGGMARENVLVEGGKGRKSMAMEMEGRWRDDGWASRENGWLSAAGPAALEANETNELPAGWDGERTKRGFDWRRAALALPRIEDGG